MTDLTGQQKAVAAAVGSAVGKEPLNPVTAKLVDLLAEVMVGQPDRRDAETTRRMQDLQEANAQLVIAGLAAQEVVSRAEQAHQQQLRFLAMVAHELRNPLAPMRTVASLLGHARIEAPQLARLQGIIERQVAHMSRLIGDLLDGSRASAGKFRLDWHVVDLLQVVDAAVQMTRPLMDKRMQRFTMHQPTVPVLVNGDVVRLTQVVSNLLDNASKYTPDEGEIRLVLAANGQAATVTVKDNGIGIKPEVLPHIFDLFVQDPAASAFALNSHGLGIGLAVVRDLVEAHGGTVTATSDGPGLGSEFVVTLLLKGADAM